MGSDTTVHKIAPCVINSQQLSREDITAVTLDQDQGELIVGLNDGMVKFYDISKADI
jgi:hypothetical protein